ncbi:MAG: O-antigen ligase family protein, partial [Candidatus Aminicenantes bacterium]|nr:O-antigen ligase family protein [Candidatus Aminicenantes bacterium]
VGFPVYLYLSGRSSLKFLIPLLMTLSVFLFIIIGLRFSEAKKLDPVKLRISNWNQAARMIEARPLFGNGLGNYESKISMYTLPGEARSIYSHNFILQITAEGGLVFVLLVLSLIVLLRKKIIPEFNKENALYISISFIILLYNFIDIGIYFFSASLLLSLVLSQLYRRKAPLPKITVFITLIFMIPQLFIFISSGVRKTGSFHLNFNRISKAEGYFLKSLRFNKFNHKSIMGLAKTSYAAGDINKSNKYLEKAIALNRLTPYAHFLRSRILYMKKKYLTSFYHAGKAISLNKRNIEYKSWYDFLNDNLSKDLGKHDSDGDTK